MKNQRIVDVIEEAILRVLDVSKVHIEHPNDESHGDYSTNIALVILRSKAGAEKVKKRFGKDVCNSRQLAEKIAKELKKDKELLQYVEAINVAGVGFINIVLSKNFYAEELFKIATQKEKYGKFDGQKKKISLEHTQVNPNKEPHVGHLRNACIGDSLARLLSFVGNEVKVQYYQNDVGVQVASIVLAYKRQFIKTSDFKSFIKWASLAYVDIEKRLANDVSLQLEKDKIQKNIASQDNNDAKLAQKITDDVLRDLLMILKKLDIEYDLVVREGDIIRNKLWEKTFELLKKAGDVFYKSEAGERKGCWLLKLPNAEDKVIVRSNGVPTYTGNDIAYHLWKFGILDDFFYKILDWGTQKKKLFSTSSEGGIKLNDFSPADSVVNIIDTTQTYPQESVKEAIRVIGYPKLADNYYHVNYGFVYLSSRTAKNLGMTVPPEKNRVKISGRHGIVIGIDEFIDAVRDKLIDEHGSNNNIDSVVNGAIKFEMLKYDTFQDIVFDMDQALDQKGYSGPYIQYTYARVKSILEKVKFDFDKTRLASNAGNIQIPNEIDRLEKAILVKIYQFPEVVKRASLELSPHYICSYLFDLAQRYNAFYNSNKVIGSDKENFRLILSLDVSYVLRNGLNLLGIKAPERM